MGGGNYLLAAQFHQTPKVFLGACKGYKPTKLQQNRGEELLLVSHSNVTFLPGSITEHLSWHCALSYRQSWSAALKPIVQLPLEFSRQKHCSHLDMRISLLTPPYRDLIKQPDMNAKLLLPDWLCFLLCVLGMWIFCAYLKERKKKVLLYKLYWEISGWGLWR